MAGTLSHASSTPVKSTWVQIPPYLHRLSIPFLIILMIIELQVPPSEASETYSHMLAAIFFCTAVLGLILERTISSTSPSTSKLCLALSLTRATIYAFIGDAAAAQLLLFHNAGYAITSTSESSEEDAPFVLTPAQWAQFMLAGSMWLLGALLWVMEPLSYWTARSRVRMMNGGFCAEEGRNIWEKEAAAPRGYLPLSQEDPDSDEEESPYRSV